MRRLKILVINFILLFILTSCARNIYMYKFPYESKDVIKMEIYNLEDEISCDKIGRFSDIEPAKVIDSKDYETLMQEVEEIPFQLVVLLIASAPSPENGFDGYVLYVEYKNGEKSIISNRLRLDYKTDGQCSGDYYGYSESFNELMERYINN